MQRRKEGDSILVCHGIAGPTRDVCEWRIYMMLVQWRTLVVRHGNHEGSRPVAYSCDYSSFEYKICTLRRLPPHQAATPLVRVWTQNPLHITIVSKTVAFPTRLGFSAPEHQVQVAINFSHHHFWGFNEALPGTSGLSGLHYTLLGSFQIVVPSNSHSDPVPQHLLPVLEMKTEHSC